MDTTAFSVDIAPYALKAGKALNMDPAFIMAQWLYETGNGTNLGSRKYNNLAGIKSAPNAAKGIFDPSDSIHAGYTSLSAFTNDYIRVMSLSRYNDVRSAAKTGSNPLAALMALNKSPWAEVDYSTTGWLRYYNESSKVIGQGGFSLENLGGDLLNINTDGLLQFLKDKWYIVAGALVAIAILKR